MPESDFAKWGTDSFRSCQDCHMSTEYKGKQLKAKIANIESADFAPTTERLPDAEIALTEREHFPRHTLAGLNVFINEMFQQFPVLLGLRQDDYMLASGVKPARYSSNPARRSWADRKLRRPVTMPTRL